MLSDDDFKRNFYRMQSRVHDVAISKGFWEIPRNDGELIMLMVTELCEAFEALRDGDIQDDKIPDFRGIEAELADTVIRIMDYAQERCLRLPEAILAKIEMNKTREHMHGKKF